jgi:hypothetical protein
MSTVNSTVGSFVRPDSLEVSRPLDLAYQGVFKWEDADNYISKIAVKIDSGNNVINYIEVFGGQGQSLGSAGTNGGDSHEINFTLGKVITDAKLFYTSWGGGRINGMSFTFQDSLGGSSSQSFGDTTGNSKHYVFPNGVILKGVYGWAGLQVDILALGYSKPVKKYEWTNINFNTSQLDSPSNIKNISVGKVESSVPASGGYKSSVLQISASTGFTNTATLSSALTLQAGIESVTTLAFPMVEGTQQIKLSGSVGRTTGNSVTVQEVVTLQVQDNVTIDAGYYGEVEGVLVQADFSLPYTATLKVTYNDDSYDTFSDKGTANCVQGLKLSLTAKPATPLTGTTSLPVANVILSADGIPSNHVPAAAKATMSAEFSKS